MDHAGSTNRQNSLTSFGLAHDTLYGATRAFLLWLQGLFSTMPTGMYKWHPDLNSSEIIITDQNPAGIEKTNKRPMIISKRGPAQVAGISRDQTSYRTFSGDSKIFSVLINSTMTLTCVAREGVEAHNLAYFVSLMLPVFKPNLQRLGRIHSISNNVQISAETTQGAIYPGSSFPEWKAVQVLAPFAVQDVISADENFYPVLKAVTLHMETGLSTG